MDPGAYYVQVSGSNPLAGYLLQAEFPFDAGVEIEPNDTLASASGNLARLSESYVGGAHVVSTDQDWYAINVPAGGRIRAEIVEAAGGESCESNGVDSLLALYDDAGVLLVTDDDEGRGFCSLIDGTGSVPLDAAARNASARRAPFTCA